MMASTSDCEAEVLPADVCGEYLAKAFGCARLYPGPDPGLPDERIFGVTSFEFG
jgi:hypothetical protein